MEKFFDEWNKEKKELDINILQIFAKPRDVCYVKLGTNIGFEENGKDGFMRPVLVINKIGSLYFVVPLTSKSKTNKYHYEIQSFFFNNKASFLILSQGRIIDGRRLIEKKGICERSEFNKIKKILRSMYFPE